MSGRYGPDSYCDALEHNPKLNRSLAATCGRVLVSRLRAPKRPRFSLAGAVEAGAGPSGGRRLGVGRRGRGVPTAPHARRPHARRLRSSAPARHEVGAGELRERTREAKRGCGRAPARVGWVAVVVGVGEGRPRGDEELGCVDSAAGGGARAAARAPCHGRGSTRAGSGVRGGRTLRVLRRCAGGRRAARQV